jgi:hypothetical protein
MDDPSTVKSRTEHIISYGGCPVIWASKLQTEVVLSTSTESEYVGLSESLRIAIVITTADVKKLLAPEEMIKSFVIPLATITPTDCSRTTQAPSTWPRRSQRCARGQDTSTRRSSTITSPRSSRCAGGSSKEACFMTVEVLSIDTLEQPADLLTKPFDLASFVNHRKAIMGSGKYYLSSPVYSFLRECDDI